MSARDLMITEAWITSPGDPAVGIFEHKIVLSYLDFDLGIYDEDDRPGVIADLRTRLQDVGALISGEDSKRVQVFLVGHDDPQPEE